MRTVAEQLVACAELGKAVTQTLNRERILEVILPRLIADFVGIAHLPGDASDLAELLRNADTSLYRSKDRGKNTITVF